MCIKNVLNSYISRGKKLYYCQKFPIKVPFCFTKDAMTSVFMFRVETTSIASTDICGQ